MFAAARERFNATRRSASNAAAYAANTTRKAYRDISSGVSSITFSLASKLHLDFSKSELVTTNDSAKDDAEIFQLLKIATEHGLQERVAPIVKQIIQLMGASMSPELRESTAQFANLPKTGMTEAIALQATLAAASISPVPQAISTLIPPTEPNEPMTATLGGGPAMDATRVVALNVLKTALVVILIGAGVGVAVIAMIVTGMNPTAVSAVTELFSKMVGYATRIGNKSGGTRKRQRRKNRQ